MYTWFLHILAYLSILWRYVAYFVLAYLCIFLHIWYYTSCAYFLHISAYLPLNIFKHITHTYAYKCIFMHILGAICTYFAYFSFAHLCIFLAYMVLHILCIFTEHSLSLGQGWVAGSKRGKPEDKDRESGTDFVTVQKGPKYFMHMCCIATCTYGCLNIAIQRRRTENVVWILLLFRKVPSTYMQPYCICFEVSENFRIFHPRHTWVSRSDLTFL